MLKKLIFSWEDLWNMRRSLDEGVTYELMRDLLPTDPDYDIYASETARDGKGFKCLGDESNFFDGTFDGRNHLIKGIYIGEAGDDGNWGLLGRLRPTAVVRDLYIDDIKVNRDGGDRCGLLASRCNDGCTVTNVHVKGEVVPVGTSDDKISGLIEFAGGGTFTKCSAELTIANAGSLIGGMFGEIVGPVVADQCVGALFDDNDSGTAKGGFASRVDSGSLVTITNCYSYGEIARTNDSAGGFIGQLQDGTNLTIEKSYSVAQMQSGAGGFIGVDNSGAGTVTIDDSFWDTDISVGTSAGATGKTTAEMQDIDTYTDTATTGLDTAWDMAAEASHTSEVWKIAASSYPDLGDEPFDFSERTVVADRLSYKKDGKFVNVAAAAPDRPVTPPGEQFPNLAAFVAMTKGSALDAVGSIDESKDYFLENQATANLLRTVGNPLAPDRAVKLDGLVQDTRFLWHFKDQGSNIYQIVNSAGGRELSTRAGSGAESAPAWLISGQTVEQQNWLVVDRGSGIFSLENQVTGKVLAHSGGVVVQQAYVGTDDQHWAIRPAEVPAETPDFAMIGWATKGDGTTGGGSETPIVVSTPNDLIDALVQLGPLVIHVDGVIDFNGFSRDGGQDVNNRWGDPIVSSDGSTIRPDGDLTLIGLSTDAEIQGTTIRLGPNVEAPREGNFIVRNIKYFLNRYVTDPGVSEDAIVIQSGCGYVWIDHCEFTADPSHPDPDGSVDILSGARYITISWNWFHDKHKQSLCGSVTGIDVPDSCWVTYHHNKWGPGVTDTRNPQFGQGRRAHVYNEYYVSDSAATAGLGNSYDIRVYAEANWLSVSTSAYEIDARELGWGRWDVYTSLLRNRVIGFPDLSGDVGWRQFNTGVEWSPKDEYEYTTNHPLNIPTLVEANAGSGKGPYAP